MLHTHVFFLLQDTHKSKCPRHCEVTVCSIVGRRAHHYATTTGGSPYEGYNLGKIVREAAVLVESGNDRKTTLE